MQGIAELKSYEERFLGIETQPPWGMQESKGSENILCIITSPPYPIELLHQIYSRREAFLISLRARRLKKIRFRDIMSHVPKKKYDGRVK